MTTTLLDRIGEQLPRTAEKIADQGGFIVAEDLLKLAAIDKLRLELLLVRCGNGRFLCPIQDVVHFTQIVRREGSDYVRDVGIPAEAGRR
jgi:hypothetical protein